VADQSANPANFLVLMADEHSPKFLGCAGHDLVKTPNLDALAARGTRFTSAYTNSPICVSARASLATGRYVHDHQCWDNAIAYDGTPPGWAHELQETGHPVTSIGKLHYTSADAPGGFDEQFMPMHIAGGVGDLHGSVRDEIPVRYQSENMSKQVGPGVTKYQDYDRNITDAACTWLNEAASNPPDKPWVLFVSYICPHFPLIAPQEYFDMYADVEIPLPKQRIDDMDRTHPWWQGFMRSYIFDQYFMDDDHRRRAIQNYLGLCTFLDDNIGRVLAALEAADLGDTTRIAYFSAHGDNMGARKMWGKSTMYEESVGVPMMLAGPGIESSQVRNTHVSLVDVFPTVLSGVGETVADETLPGTSLLGIVNAPDDPDRTVFSEYHGAGARTAAFMLRRGPYKYIHYVDFTPELYDLEADPEELRDLSASPDHQQLIKDFEKQLRSMVDPEAIDRAAKKDQAALIERHGGREQIVSGGGIHGTPVPKEGLANVD
jgi:choline-sulfatase